MASKHCVLEKFDCGDNWESYSEKLDQYFVASNTAVDEKAAVLLAVLSPPMYNALRDLCHPEVPQLKTYPELSRLLESHCLQQAFVFNERVKFNKAVQTDVENVARWLSRVMSFAISCDFGTQLESMIKDRFVSGLADRRMVSRLCGEVATKTLRQLVDSATTMEQGAKPLVDDKPSTSAQNLIPTTCKVEPGSPKTADAFSLPEEIWIKIILHLNPRERLPLGNSCRKFSNLVFENKQVLRKLNFSIDGALTSPSDIHQYFKNETARQHIRELNLKNVKFLKPGTALSNSIGKVINLVDLNLGGIIFTDIQQLASLLNPLVCLRGLSIYWQLTGPPSHHWYKLLEKPFSRLTYLSVNVPYEILDKFCSCLHLCQELERLCLQVIEGKSCNYRITERLKVLKNLKIVEFCGSWTNEMKKQLITMLSEPWKWTDFHMTNQSSDFEWDFYLEKNVEVCKELVGGQWMKAVPNAKWKDFGLGWALIPELLVKHVLELSHEDVPQTLCCFSGYEKDERCLLTIKEAKRLLKDPWYQVSYLYVHHGVEIGCDVHLIASAFQHLTEIELKLCRVTSGKTAIQSEPPSLNQLRRKGWAAPRKPDDPPNLDSSFRLLVKNTPHLIHFSLDASPYNYRRDSPWDMDALYQIARWKNLRTLRLCGIPSSDGKYLIEIGKQCTQLQRLELQVKQFPNPQHFTEELIQMLPHCQNLTKFFIGAGNLGLPLSDVFNALANNKQLAIVDAYNLEYVHTVSTLVSSFEKLLHSCSGMTRFNCQIPYTNKADFRELSSGVQRLKRQLSRPNLQILVACEKDDASAKEIGCIPENILEFTLFSHISPTE